MTTKGVKSEESGVRREEIDGLDLLDEEDNSEE